MTRRVLEIAFTHKLLLIAPIILGAALGIFLMMSSNTPAYRSASTLWVERPLEVSLIDYNPYISPAENQARHMRELLGTKVFAEGALKRATESAGWPPIAQVTIDDLRRNVFIFASGDHLLIVSGGSSLAEVAPALVNGVLDEYSAIQLSQYQERNDRLRDQFERQVEVANLEFQEANKALSDYLRAHPLRPEQSITEASSLDPELTRLATAEQSARSAYESFLARFADSQRTSSQAQGTLQSFSILDEAEVPLAPAAKTKRQLAIKPMAGLVVGSLASMALFLLFWRMDRTIRSASDLELLGFDSPVMSLPVSRISRKDLPLSTVLLAVGLQGGIKNGVSPQPVSLPVTSVAGEEAPRKVASRGESDS